MKLLAQTYKIRKISNFFRINGNEDTNLPLILITRAFSFIHVIKFRTFFESKSEHVEKKPYIKFLPAIIDFYNEKKEPCLAPRKLSLSEFSLINSLHL